MGKPNKTGKPKADYTFSIYINRIKPAAQERAIVKLACLDLSTWEKIYLAKYQGEYCYKLSKDKYIYIYFNMYIFW